MGSGRNEWIIVTPGCLLCGLSDSSSLTSFSWPLYPFLAHGEDVGANPRTAPSCHIPACNWAQSGLWPAERTNILVQLHLVQSRKWLMSDFTFNLPIMDIWTLSDRFSLNQTFGSCSLLPLFVSYLRGVPQGLRMGPFSFQMYVIHWFDAIFLNLIRSNKRIFTQFA